MTQKSCTRTASSTWSKQSCSEVSTCVPKTGPTERVTCNQEDRDSYTSPTCSAGYIGSGPNLSPNYCYNSNGKIIGDAKCPAGTTMTSKGCKTVKTVTVECVQTKTGTTYGEWNCNTSYPSSCTPSENSTRKVECSGPNYKKSTCTRSLISSGDYVKWTIINTETVDSCTEKKDTLHKVECSEKKSFIKTTSKKGTIEVCEQCVVRTPDTEKPVVEISSKKCENGSCIISAKLTDNVGVVEFAYSKNSDEKKVSGWISLGGSYTEQTVEIKNVDETKIITAKDLEKETALDLGINLKQEDTIIKNVVRVTNNSKLSYNVCNIVIEVPIDNNVTLVKDSINISGIDKTLVKTNIETNKITFIIDKMLQVNEKIEITFDTKLKNNNVKKVTLEPTVKFYETKEQTCSKDKESDIVISKKQDLKVVIISNVPDTGRSTTTFVILGTISLAIGTGLVYSILKKSKDFFKEEIVESHIKNTIKLNNINKFNINPFIHRYLAQFAFGNSDPKSLAKVLIYPRVLGTSINTTFGNKMQAYCGKVLSGNGSLVDGMDIEFIDCIDGKKKYCQIKAGPQTINKDDVTTIINHFSSAIRLSRTNNLNISSENCMVGVIYGEQKDLSNNYKKIDYYYPVYIGKE
ncbi:MAG: hypothetical protein BHW63_02560, partial [Mycoplasma sp. CAG:611_25_7]